MSTVFGTGEAEGATILFVEWGLDPIFGIEGIDGSVVCIYLAFEVWEEADQKWDKPPST